MSPSKRIFADFNNLLESIKRIENEIKAWRVDALLSSMGVKVV
jgi:hypothetical protein